MACRSTRAFTFGWLAVLAACGPEPLGTDDDVGETDGTETDGTEAETETEGDGDGDGDGPIPIECEPAGGQPGQQLWTKIWAGPSGYEDEGRGIDVDGAGKVLVAGVTRTTGNGISWNPYFAAYELDGAQLWSQELDLGESREVNDVRWIGPDAFVGAGSSSMGAVLSGFTGQATMQWEDLRIVPGDCDPEFNAGASYVDLSVGAMGFAVGMAAVEDIGDLCYEVSAGVELRSFAGDELWASGLAFADSPPGVGLGDGILFAAAGSRLYGLDGDGAPLWDAQDVPEAQGLAIGRSGKVVSQRRDSDGTAYLAERNGLGGVVWEKLVFVDADQRRIGDMAIDPCDDSIVIVGSESDVVWIMKLDADGDEQWSASFDPLFGSPSFAMAVAIAGDSTIVVAGRQGAGQAVDGFAAAFSG